MILFNTTFAVDSNQADDFIEFIRDTYIPMAEMSGIYGLLLSELHGETSDNTITGQPVRTFALQMRVPSDEAMTDFHEQVLPNIYHVIGESWGMGVSMFESKLDVIYDHSKANGRNN